MDSTYRYTIDDRQIHVFDDLVAPDLLETVGFRFESSAYLRDESDGPDKAEVRTFNVDMPAEEFEATLGSLVEKAVTSLFPDRELELMRVHCNLIVYGDMAFPHRDCAPGRDDVTALIFVNRHWEREWGGEITFFNNAGDAVTSITPRPGRMLVFEGALEHRVGIPLRNCFAPRLTLACKYKTPGDWR